jgi:hypothetical protein
VRLRWRIPAQLCLLVLALFHTLLLLLPRLFQLQLLQLPIRVGAQECAKLVVEVEHASYVLVLADLSVQLHRVSIKRSRAVDSSIFIFISTFVFVFACSAFVLARYLFTGTSGNSKSAGLLLLLLLLLLPAC